MTETVLRIWGRTIKLANFTGEDLAEVFETFGGSIGVVTDGSESELTVHRQYGNAVGSGNRRSRHRGGSPAGKYFLDGTPFDGAEQRRDITIVSEGSGCDAYAEDRALLVVAGDTATIVADDLPPMLVSDVIEDWLLCHSRANGAVQVHCAGGSTTGAHPGGGQLGRLASRPSCFAMSELAVPSSPTTAPSCTCATACSRCAVSRSRSTLAAAPSAPWTSDSAPRPRRP